MNGKTAKIIRKYTTALRLVSRRPVKALWRRLNGRARAKARRDMRTAIAIARVAPVATINEPER